MDYITNLRNIRKAKGYSQADIADILETTQQHYSCYENGKNELPIRHLITLCKFYSVSADTILGLTDKKSDVSNMTKYEVKNTMTGESATMYFAENITINDK